MDEMYIDLAIDYIQHAWGIPVEKCPEYMKIKKKAGRSYFVLDVGSPSHMSREFTRLEKASRGSSVFDIETFGGSRVCFFIKERG